MIITEQRECKDGWYTFDRPSLDIMLTITQSERDCRKGEVKRLDAPDGWSPLVVVLVTTGIVVLVGGAAFGVGYAVGAR